MINLSKKCQEFGITPKGVIHIGGEIESSYQEYMSMDIKRIIFVTKDTTIYNYVKSISVDNPNVIFVNCVVHDKNHNSTENSIEEVHRTLDQLLTDIKQLPSDYNILVNHTQSCQDFILFGAQKFLKHAAIVLNPVGCSTDNNMELMQHYHFKHYSNQYLDHNYYVSDQLIQVSTIGINGRFANQVFQHMFASCYAKAHNLKTEFPTWIGQQFFDIQDNPITRQLEQVQINNRLPTEDLSNKDVIGWFQYHTSYYLPYKSLILKTYQLYNALKSLIDAEIKRVFQERTLISIHLRHGDYGQSNDFFIPPVKWYINWLEAIWHKIENPVLYIASDNPDVYKEFKTYNPLTSKNIQIAVQAFYLIDFYILTQSDYLAISNSSFSFLASMLNIKNPICFRPSLSEDKLIYYEPWNSNVILKETPKKHQNISGDNKIRNLHIGGQEPKENWEILNLENTAVTDHIGDAGNLFKFDDNTFDNIYASHILEHFDYLKLPDVLKEWYRVLKLTGKIYISVPDFEIISELIIKKYHKSVTDQFNLIRMIFGGHIDQNDYHNFGFTKIILEKYLTAAGFINIKKVKLFDTFNDTSSLRYNGTLISLNVTAEKE